MALKILVGKPLPSHFTDDVASITADEVTEARSFFPMDKYFIFGHARSGTTVLARLIRLHPEVHCSYQAHFFTRPPLLKSLVAREEIKEWLTRPSNRWNRGKDLSPVVLRAIADYILERDARLEGKHIVGDKSPNSLMDGNSVKSMHQVYPDAKLIYIVRDGRDTAISHRFQTFIDRQEFLSNEDRLIREEFARDPQPFLNGERSIFTEISIQHAAQGWMRNVNETDHFGRELYGKNYLSIRYEDLLVQTWQVMQKVWKFLDAASPSPELQTNLDEELKSNPDAEWQQQKASEIATPLEKGKRGSWREMFTPRDLEIFTQLAGETLQAWGYGSMGVD